MSERLNKCKEITDSIDSLKTSFKDFQNKVQSSTDGLELSGMKERILLELESILEKIGPEYLFISELQDEKNWNKFQELIDDCEDGFRLRIDYPEQYEKIKNIFTESKGFPTSIKLTTESLQSFWQLFLKDNFIQGKIVDLSRGSQSILQRRFDFGPNKCRR